MTVKVTIKLIFALIVFFCIWYFFSTHVISGNYKRYVSILTILHTDATFKKDMFTNFVHHKYYVTLPTLFI